MFSNFGWPVSKTGRSQILIKSLAPPYIYYLFIQIPYLQVCLCKPVNKVIVEEVAIFCYTKRLLLCLFVTYMMLTSG